MEISWTHRVRMMEISWTHRVRMKYYVESRTIRISYIKKNGRLTGLVTSGVGTAY